MSDVLAKKHESLATAKEIMDSLKGMFGQSEWSLRHEAIKYIYTKRMKEGTSVREHVLDTLMDFNIAEVNGGAIDEANQETSSWKRLSGGEITLKVGTGEMNKSDSFEKFKEYKAEVENESASTPQQNGVSERRNRTLLDMVRSMMSFAQLPNSFWGYALETTIYILNNVPSKSVSETSYEIWKGCKGVYVTLGFGDVQHTCWNIGQAHHSQELGEPRHSGRVVRQPDRYLGLSEAQIIMPDDGVEDPSTFKQAMNDVDSDQWIKAMNLEMESMYSNSIWTLVDQPSDVNPIGCKWIYKRKRDQAGKVQTFKARLVAKGIVSRYQSNPGRDHWTAVKNILEYLRRTKDYMLVYGSKDMILTGYTDSDFQTDKDARKPRENRPSLQTGELDKTVIFPLSTLSVLRDNDAIVEIELLVPDTLPTSAESSESNSNTWLELYFESIHVEMFCYFTNQVMSGLHLMYVGKGQQGLLEETMSVSFTPSFGLRQQVVREGESCHHVPADDAGRIMMGRRILPKEIGRPEKAGPSDLEKMYGIERLKKLGATVFEGFTDPANTEVEAWWKSIIVRRNDSRTLDWQTFRGIFEEKYYPTTYYEAKRDEFLELKQGSLSVVEYERKYTELSRYAEMIVASESDRCRRFERGLRFEIRTPMTAIAKWMNFSQLVETALRVEQSIVEEKSTMELSRGVSTTSGSAYQRQSQRASSQSANSVARSRTGQESVASESRRTPCCGQTGHFKRDCPQLRVAVRRDQGVESHTVEQPRISTAAGEGTSGARQKGVVGRPRQ
ncbi:gag/pol protein [Cucumis melo var. makuwa]|uniref:Gag/pol protein n=1 Tax=Cucumis melo var. makuwa TaxID=1194695 RepID=A0A5D3D5E2_CUCMM|nr:gag/pol protein [Cucumis melo var. makuwa]